MPDADGNRVGTLYWNVTLLTVDKASETVEADLLFRLADGAVFVTGEQETALEVFHDPETVTIPKATQWVIQGGTGAYVGAHGDRRAQVR